ncbi:hypothetical protein O6P43_034545 [Quillaja saponaria]|uniref:Uncharacterized protein n=1 Tax=Quillaja saponaria TaxID=32244 RepID=A0AAD7KP92_QUISA|nr:hypothetical protein O6P43_034545 [Quillaja saponaria]
MSRRDLHAPATRAEPSGGWRAEPLEGEGADAPGGDDAPQRCPVYLSCLAGQARLHPSLPLLVRHSSASRGPAPCSRTELHARSTPHRGTEGRHGLGCKLPVPVLATCTTEFQTLDRPSPADARPGQSADRRAVLAFLSARSTLRAVRPAPARFALGRSTRYTDEGSTRTLSSHESRSDR